MGRLGDRLDRIRESFAKQAPPEAKAVMQRHTESLRQSGIMANAPAVGSTLPPFALEDTDGQVVRSDDLLAKGTLVLSLYRGVW